MSALENEIKEIVNSVLNERLASLPRPGSPSGVLDQAPKKEIAVYEIISHKPYLSKQELALYLDCSDRSIEEWTQRPTDKNPLPVGRAGRDLRFKREKVDEWMEREGERYWRQKNLREAS